MAGRIDATSTEEKSRHDLFGLEIVDAAITVAILRVKLDFSVGAFGATDPRDRRIRLSS